MRLTSNRIYLIIGLITAVVLTAAFVLGLMSSNKMREVISEQFNQQQLIMAKSAASAIEEKFAFLKNELHTLNLSPAIQYLEVSWPNRMQITMDNVQPYGVVEIGLVVPGEGGHKGRIFRLDKQGNHRVTEIDTSHLHFFSWAQNPSHKGQFYIKRTTLDFQDDSKPPYLLVAIPTYQVSVDESHPIATGDFSGCLFFLLKSYPGFHLQK